MKVRKIFKPAVIKTATAVLMLCPMAFAQKLWDAPRVVTWNCSRCHGIDGNAQLPFFPPLAALNALYAEQRMAQFRVAAPPPVDELFNRITAPDEGKAGASSRQARINLVGSAHALTDDETKTAIAWYAMQKQAPGQSCSPALIQLARRYSEGSPGLGPASRPELLRSAGGRQGQNPATRRPERHLPSE